MAALASVALACGGGGKSTSDACSSGDHVVCGRVTYDRVPSVYDPASESGGLDFAHAAQLPVRDATVIVVQGDLEIARGRTGDDGRYALSFSPSGDGPLAVVAFAQTATPAVEVRDNTDGGLRWGIGADIGTGRTTKDLRATHGWTASGYAPDRRLAAPFAVLDTMNTAARAFLTVRPQAAFPPLVVNWSPANTPSDSIDPTRGDIGTSHFDPGSGQIYVLGKEGADTDEFDKAVIAHEWGHFFEHYLSRSDSPGGPHAKGDALDPRLAFGEGYGDALASMVLADPIYADTLWQGGDVVGFGWDAETVPAGERDATPGVLSEMKVTRLLYDLYDGKNEPFDQVALGLGPIYDVLTGPERTTAALTTIGSFVAGLKAQPGVDEGAVDTLLAAHDMGPLTSAFGDGDDALARMYLAADLPSAGTIQLTGGHRPNEWWQVQYFVFTGNGAQVTVGATTSEDVAIDVYDSGNRLAHADDVTSGTETVHVATDSGKPYVVVITGFAEAPGEYDVALSFTTP